MTCRTATQLVVACENALGWTPADDKPLWKARAIEAGKINKQMVKNPKKVTLANLELALEYSARKRIGIRTPVGLVYRIDEALAAAAEPEIRGDISFAIEAAVQQENATKRFGYEAWMTRLMQAQGPGRQTVLNEWKSARG